MDAIERIRSLVRTVVAQIARAVNGASGGRITPAQVTVASVLLHGLIVWAVIDSRLVLAGVMLIIFGLMDTLDGELARLQGKASNSGIVLDAAADRYKEGLIYAGLAVYFSELNNSRLVFVCVLALSASFLITFVKTKGEAVLAEHNHAGDAQALNRSFGNETFFRFEIRMTLLVIGLVTNWLPPILYLLAIGGLVSAVLRYNEVDRRLERL